MSKVKQAVAKLKNFDFVPTKEEMISGAEDLGGVALAFIASHAGLSLIKKQDSALINGGLLIGGLYGAMKVKQPFFKALCIGAGTYGAIKLASKAVNAVTTPGATEGLAGILPESVKETLRKYIPTLSGIDELSGDNDHDFSNLSLDDQGFEGTDDDYSTPNMGNVDFNLAAA